jgi:leucyl-tRNA synthetase
MSKSKYNVVHPDEVVNKYGADTLRLYEMFLGPIEISKPWDTNGIEGVHRFLKKLWRLFYTNNELSISQDLPTMDEQKILHRCIKRIEEDIHRFSLNTCVSTFMICVNELADAKCNKSEILKDLLRMIAPFAPHITEELWFALGKTNSICLESFPVFEEKYLVENSFTYPIMMDGKKRTEINLSLTLSNAEIEEIVLANEIVTKWTNGNKPKKVIIVKNKIVNIVI